LQNTNTFNIAIAITIAAAIAVRATIATISITAAIAIPITSTIFATITTVFPGADPARVEALVTAKIETELRTIPEIAEVSSTSATAISVVSVELVETDRIGDGPLDGFHSVTLWERDPGPTARLLTEAFGYHEQGHETDRGVERLRLVAPGTERGNIIDLIRTDAPAKARPGAGTIHHVAFRARSDSEQRDWQELLAACGHPTTPVIDRQYFNAIYFREPGGVLFEIATDPPGFAVDEPVATLGHALKLPPKYEAMRERITQILPPLKVA
jgi:catechol 2,3-dioxygenase-like lactoylglutathione lyase family enzyme